MLFTKTKNAGDIIRILKELKKKLKHTNSLKIAYIHCDNSKGKFGLEFQNSIREIRIQVKLYPLYKHSMNKVAKCYIGLVNKIAKSMLYKLEINSNF